MSGLLQIRGRTLRPVVQGGMGVGISRWRLAGSVAAGGGMGTLAAQGLGRTSALHRPDAAKQWIDPHGVETLGHEVRAALDHAGGNGLVAVNIMVAISHYHELVRSAVDAGAHAIVTGAGLPMDLPDTVGDADVALIPIVSSARALRSICRYWEIEYGRRPDAVVVEGPKAGGHLGYKEEQLDDPAFQLESIVPQVAEIARSFGGFPVIAAGGIWDAADAARMADHGASAVQLGTRFVATAECDVHPHYKQLMVDATADDLVVLRTPVGMPGRVLRTPLIERFLNKDFDKFKCHFRCLSICDAPKVSYCIADHLIAAAEGDPDGFYFAGVNATRVQGIETVAAILDAVDPP